MPERLHPRVAELALDGIQHHWQPHRWCEGHNPTEPDDDLADWTGATLAALHRRDGGTLTLQPGLYPLDAWHEWLKGHATHFTQRIRRHLPTVAAALAHLDLPSPPLTPVATVAGHARRVTKAR